MRLKSLAIALVICVAGVSAGCGQSPAPAQPAATAEPSNEAQGPAPAAADGNGETIRVVISGGEFDGTYTSKEDPLCSKDKVRPGVWNVDYSTIDLTGDKDLTAVYLTFVDGTPPPTDGLYAGVQVWADVRFGELMSPNSRKLVFRVSATGAEGSGSATAQDGDRPILRAVGTTATGVGVDVTVNCIDKDGMP